MEEEAGAHASLPPLAHPVPEEALLRRSGH